MATKREKLFLLDKYVDEIIGSKLPSRRQALGYFLYLHRQQKQAIRIASTATIDKVQEFWDKACIPVRHKQDCIKQVE